MTILPLLLYLCFLFFFNDPPTPEIYTLSLHDALPIWTTSPCAHPGPGRARPGPWRRSPRRPRRSSNRSRIPHSVGFRRSEEHTSELQSHVNLVCRLLLEKKKKNTQKQYKNRSITVRQL